MGIKANGQIDHITSAIKVIRHEIEKRLSIDPPKKKIDKRWRISPENWVYFFKKISNGKSITEKIK